MRELRPEDFLRESFKSDKPPDIFTESGEGRINESFGKNEE